LHDTLTDNAMTDTDDASPGNDEDSLPACVLVFNASDPSGAGGLSADITSIASVGAHALPVTTGAYARDTSEIFDHFAFDEDAVSEQARAILEDVPVQIIKVGFAGSPENLGIIAEIASDYADVPLVAYMPDLSWWNEASIDAYLDAFRDLLLPQTTVLTGSHGTLWRWLLPDWTSDRPPSARDIARAAAEFGVSYTLVTGIPLPEQHTENALATPESVLVSGKLERFEASFVGAGDTLSAAVAALLATGCDLSTATTEALSYLDECLNAGFRPGMGGVVPDRLFWAQPDDDGEEDDTVASSSGMADFENPFNDTRH
jgi:hydroxymethylpyrimidine/phosphomethylpyrimidine kinase